MGSFGDIRGAFASLDGGSLFFEIASWFLGVPAVLLLLAEVVPVTWWDLTGLDSDFRTFKSIS